jgi:hypothetical protein
MIWTFRLPRLHVPTLGVGARVTAALLCLAAAPVGAQRTTLTVGQTVSAELDGLDPAFGSGVRFEVFEFQGRAGERVTATLRSADFDAVLRLARTVAGITDELETDDDGGGDTDARLRASLPETGTYLLIAQAFAADEEGAFTLSLEATPEPTTATARPLAVGQTVEAVLAETDALDEDEGVFYDVWTVEARAGQRLVAVMEAEAFDAYLRFGRLDADGAFEELEVDDDGGGGTDARLRTRAPNTGVYELRATSLEESTGEYRLSLAEGVAPAETASREPIRVGETATGELSDADAVRDDEQYYDYWVYESRGDERLTVRLTSEAFDAFLEFGRLDGESFLAIESNDDGPDGTDSELEVSLSSSGTYVIRASSYEAGRTGPYRVQVTRR